MNLAEFLLARIDEDEAGARSLLGHDSRDSITTEWLGFLPGRGSFAERLLAECEAKKLIVEAHRHESRGSEAIPARTPVAGALFWVMRELAQPYRDHPDFDPAWSVT